jgi:hypothetical protein
MASRGGPHQVMSRLGRSRCLRTGSFVPRRRILGVRHGVERELTSAASGRGGRSGRPPALGPQLGLVTAQQRPGHTAGANRTRPGRDQRSKRARVPSTEACCSGFVNRQTTSATDH